MFLLCQILVYDYKKLTFEIGGKNCQVRKSVKTGWQILEYDRELAGPVSGSQNQYGTALDTRRAKKQDSFNSDWLVLFESRNVLIWQENKWAKIITRECWFKFEISNTYSAKFNAIKVY